MKNKTWRIWLDKGLAGVDTADVIVTLPSNLSNEQIESELLGAILEEANIDWGYEEVPDE
jgi:hypothetical protein